MVNDADIETAVLHKLKRLPTAQKQVVLDFVEFLEMKWVMGEQTEEESLGFYVSPDQAAMQREEVAFQTMLPQLLARYENEYVAVYQGEVIDHDPDQGNLVRRLDQTHPNAVVLVKKVTAEPEPMLRMPSPRLIKDH
jgi:hypothetical protein